VRPGRVDRSIHLGNTTAAQARRLFAWFYAGGEPDEEIDRLSREFGARVGEARACMAAIQEHLLRHRTDPEAAVESLDLDRLASHEAARVEPEPPWPADAGPPGAIRDRALAHD
jgi:mitochondrial chaperone BCS1